MNEKERQGHKERRKKKKQRRKERKKEEAKQARIADHKRRIETEVERVVQERVERGELLRAPANNVAVPSCSGQSKEQKVGANGEPGGSVAENKEHKSRKRVASIHPKGVPQKAARTASHIKEISRYHITVTGKHLGSGSYGSCYLGHYRGLNVVMKNLRVKTMQGESVSDAEKRVRTELLYEARIINKLGDHPGLPLLFGICSEIPPFRLVMQFHGDSKNKTAHTISSALSASRILISKEQWLKVIADIARALTRVHRAGFLHNDIKTNNVVLDIVDGQYNPVLIDFGKSLPLTDLKGPKNMSEEQQIKYSKDFPHIAPEIVTGKQGQSIKSDIYSFGKLSEVVFRKADLGRLQKVLRQALNVDPKERPGLEDILKALC